MKVEDYIEQVRRIRYQVEGWRFQMDSAARMAAEIFPYRSGELIQVKGNDHVMTVEDIQPNYECPEQPIVYAKNNETKCDGERQAVMIKGEVRGIGQQDWIRVG